MEIFGVGLPELILIAVVALIVLGPERLPEAARAAGRAVSELRKAVEPARSAWTELSSEISGVTETMAARPRATIKASRPGEKTTAIPTDNPWKVHPITEGMTDEDRRRTGPLDLVLEMIGDPADREAAEALGRVTMD